MALHDTLASAFGAAAAGHRDSVALIDASRPSGPRVTFGQLADEVEHAAHFLVQEVALSPGEVMCTWLPNVAESIVLQLAAARIGVLTVNLNTRFREQELAAVLGSTGAVALIVPTGFLGIDFTGIADSVLEDPTRRLPRLRHAVHVDLAGHDLPSPDWRPRGGLRSSTWRVGHRAAGSPDVPLPQCRPGDAVVAFSTSGTTGAPKLAVHTHAAVTEHLMNVAQAFDLRPDDRLLATLPLCGAFGFTGVLAALLAGTGVVLQPVFKADEAVRLFRQESITHAYGPDVMLSAIVDASQEREALKSWRCAAFADFSGAGQQLGLRLDRELGIPARGVYGASELLAFLAIWPENAEGGLRHQSGGLPVSPAIEVRCVEATTGAQVPSGCEGELQFRGYCVMSGYLGDPDASIRAFTDDGWYRTGDLGFLNEDGTFTFRARLGDTLRLGGFLVDPAEIESLLLAERNVTAAAVVGVSQPGAGDRAVAFIECSGPVDTGALQEQIRIRAAAFKTPAHIVTVESLPRVDGPNGSKVQRGALRMCAADLLAELDQRKAASAEGRI